jgi:hypothetical protein
MSYYGNPPESGQFPYTAFLIERGSPAKYWVQGDLNYPPAEQWTDDADRALKFATEAEARQEEKRLNDAGINGTRVCGHGFNCGISPEGD